VEISLTRLLSVTTWYPLAFFAISTAMLGMTAGDVTVYLKPAWFSEGKLGANLALSCVGFALAAPVSLILLCVLPLSIPDSTTDVLMMVAATAYCCLPFCFSGVAIAAVLTQCPLPIGRLYGSDLAGASIGCLAVLAGVEFLDVPSLVLVFSALGAAAACSFAWKIRPFAYHRTTRPLVLVLVVAPFVNATAPRGISTIMVKGEIADRTSEVYEKWNSFSRVVVYRGR
jgi:hypothetical protein